MSHTTWLFCHVPSGAPWAEPSAWEGPLKTGSARRSLPRRARWVARTDPLLPRPPRPRQLQVEAELASFLSSKPTAPPQRKKLRAKMKGSPVLLTLQRPYARLSTYPQGQDEASYSINPAHGRSGWLQRQGVRKRKSFVIFFLAPGRRKAYNSPPRTRVLSHLRK